MGLSLLHTHEPPLVSCIMPTRNRRSFVPQSILYFLRQDYPQKELIIIDDGDDNVADLIPADERIRYPRLDQLLQRNCSFVITNNSYPAKEVTQLAAAEADMSVHGFDDVAFAAANSAAHVGLRTGGTGSGIRRLVGSKTCAT